ncbi:hypothetical protein ACHAWF_004129 [Thalassiosira exigua]
MVTNFGFHTLEDGTRVCYHHGEYFHGNLPVISQIMMLVFKIHARWVAWATEHHINQYAFTEEGEEAEEMEEQSRENMPMFLLTNYAWSDLKAMFFGSEEDVSANKKPSFLVVKEAEEGTAHEPEKKEDKLPFQKKAIQIQISEDIESDKKAMKELLAQSDTQSAEDIKAVLVRRHTIARRRTTGNGPGIASEKGQQTETVEGSSATTGVYVMAKDLALERAQMRRMTRQMTRRLNQNEAHEKNAGGENENV